jgi:hypothetical protein
MSDYPYDMEIDVNRLLFDEGNPRIPDGTSGQREAMLRLAQFQGPKLVGLAEHIAKHGLNPAQRFIVVPDGKNFRVLDGNRRLCAVKALDTPSAFSNLPKSRVARLGQLGDGASVPRTIACAVFKDADQAEPWLRLTHLDQRSGEGVAKWSAQQKARHEERLGGSRPPGLQVLDFVRDGGHLSPTTQALVESGSFPMTMIDRMLEAKSVRPLVGIDLVGGVKDGVVSTDFSKEQVLRSLTRFIEDIAAKKATSRKLNTTEEMATYFRNYGSADLPDMATRGPKAVPLAEAPASIGTGATKPHRRRDRAPSAKRTFLIPATTDLEIAPNRIHSIYLELKTVVRVDDAPNAAGALLRVFLDMSLLLYMKRAKVPTKGLDHLRENWAAVRAHLETGQILDKKAINAIQASIIDSSSGLTTIQAVVHNPDFAVAGPELKSLWERLEPLFKAIWPVTK